MDQHDEVVKNHALIVYLLLGSGLFVGITWVVGGVWAYVKRGDYPQIVLNSHFSYQIRTFWWTIAWFIIFGVLTVVGIGLIGLVILWLWAAYRIIRGLFRLSDNRGML